jgi:predicted ABC-type ATPase
MPTLYILAGPNGAGKTTFYFTAVEEGFIDKNLPFINTDLITRNELGDYTEENFARAEAIVRNRIAEYISKQENFLVESNLARQSDYDWLKSIKAKGYSISFIFCVLPTSRSISAGLRKG